MSSVTVRVGRASTGLGLFAAKPIAAKAYIVTYQGRRIPTAEAHRREREGGEVYVRDQPALDHRRLVATQPRALHQPCLPAELRSRAAQGPDDVRGAARHCAGEEITLDYGKEYFDLFIAPFGCRCAACAKRAAKIYGKAPGRGVKKR